MVCKICNHQNNQIFQANILNKYDINYFHCKHCGFLQTEEPFWLEEAYNEPINLSDTGYIQRNVLLSKKMTVLLALFFNHHGIFLDYAGGYGVFVRMMRDIGFDFYWEDKYTANLFAKGFEYNQQPIEAITTFESFEHFVNPIEEIEKMLSISKNIIFSTELLPKPIPNPQEWWYYGLDHGQHVSFYTTQTLQFIAEKYHLNYLHLGNLHLFTYKDISSLKLTTLRLTKLGLHKVLQHFLQSKTWKDHLKMSRHQ